MKACPKCQTKNQESSNFCKKCGVKLSDTSFTDKREKVLGETRRKSYWLPISLAIIAIALGGVGYWIIAEKSSADPRVSSQPKVSGKVD